MASVRISPLFCALLLSACGRADASSLDPSNPIHCAIAFQGYSDSAMKTGNERLAKGFGGRAQWYIDRAKSSGQTLPSRQELEELADRFLKAKDRGLSLSAECLKRQDADPGFQALVRKQ